MESGGKFVVTAIFRLRSRSFVDYVSHVGSRTDAHLVDDVWSGWTNAMFLLWENR